MGGVGHSIIKYSEMSHKSTPGQCSFCDRHCSHWLHSCQADWVIEATTVWINIHQMLVKALQCRPLSPSWKPFRTILYISWHFPMYIRVWNALMKTMQVLHSSHSMTLYKQKGSSSVLHLLFALTGPQCNRAMLVAHSPPSRLLVLLVDYSRYKDRAALFRFCRFTSNIQSITWRGTDAHRVGEREKRKQVSSCSSGLTTGCQWRWGERG